MAALAVASTSVDVSLFSTNGAVMAAIVLPSGFREALR